MFLGSKDAVLAMLHRFTESQPANQPLRIAVAFWGSGAERIVSREKQYQIICNLLSGGTNPEVIRVLRAMPNVEIRHLTELHAKVVLASTGAIVGSSNFSADGLGFGDAPRLGWLEAAAVIEAADVERWFERHWRASADISDEALARAAEVWANRAAQRLGEVASSMPSEPVPQLSEFELFKAAITGGNRIRMAAKPIEQIYFREIEPETKRSVWNPAYASSLLWTTAGNRIRTKIDDCPCFERPSDVLTRAKYPKTIEKVHRFLSVLSRHPGVSPAIRYWANEYLRSAT
ncbi:MAG: phospholipase D family protein [Aromatoleum sp.]|jgi:hypothetical protein|uniref:phospholipase D family protein n=1 Tax=Aromatoleum sp. TaxID=2307007 RepID=UPI0028956D4D|nr:phospholipase D family protein [Aromatoleum sp.]MDT3668956.1 phospholipase D family protein [Aromatoleum sp.]